MYKQGLLSKDSYASQSKRFKKLYFDMLKEYNDRDEMTEVNNTNMQFEQHSMEEENSNDQLIITEDDIQSKKINIK